MQEAIYSRLGQVFPYVTEQGVSVRRVEQASARSLCSLCRASSAHPLLGLSASRQVMKVLLRMRKTSPRLFLQPCGSSSSSSSGSSSGGGSQGRDLASQWEYGSFKYGVFGFNDSTTGTTTGRRYTPNPSPTPNRDQSVATAEERRASIAVSQRRRRRGGL